MTELYTPKAAGFPSVSWLVFNCNSYEKEKGREAVIAKFGRFAWRRLLKKRMSTGIMEIFHYTPDEESICFINAVAEQVDKRMLKTHGPAQGETNV